MRPVKPIHVIGFGLFVFLAIALLSGQATSAAILAESTYPKIPAPVVTVPPTVPPPCQLAWRIMSTPDGFENDHLAGIDGLSPDSLWAVGYEGYEKAHYRTLTLHWDGSQWSRLPSPSPDLFSRLYSVDVVAEDDVWAVGQAGLFPNSGTLIMHWNGSAWSVVPSPSPGTNNYLAGVSAVSATDIWAVGAHREAGIDRALVLHYDGTSWTQTLTPVFGPYSYLYSVEAISTGEVWAVGAEGGSGVALTLTARWNGIQWAIVPSPNPGPTGNRLHDLDAHSATDMWAVGSSGGEFSGQTITMHWDGTQWTLVPSPDPGGDVATLNSVTIIGPDDVWAVGASATIKFGWQSLLMHWDGSQWTLAPPSITSSQLAGVHSFSTEDVWAVGYHSPSSDYSPLVLRYSRGECGSVTPSATTGPSLTPTRTHTHTRTPTTLPTNTATYSPTSTQTHTNTPTQTPTFSPTHTATNTPLPPTSTPTICPLQFNDVPGDHTFYANIRCLACRGIIGGYADGSFRPGNNITRGQIAKMVSNAAGYDEDPNPQIFEDVSTAHTFYAWINRLARRGHMGGYPCGGEGEPCGSGDRPYFRPQADATRGQVSKIVANAAGFSDTPPVRTFTDVPYTHPFWLWIERLASRGIMGGYPCGGTGEPCDSESRPYFRPQNNITRGQTAKIVAGTFFQGCETP